MGENRLSNYFALTIRRKGGQRVEKINGQMVIAEVIGKYPETVPVLKGLGIHCLG